MSSLADVRTDLFDLLSTVSDDVNVYRRRQTNYQYPALMIGWPQSMDVRAAMGSVRTFVLDVIIGVESTDDDSSDDDLSDLLEETVNVILDGSEWDVEPATDFGEELTADNRVILSCRLPVAVFS